MEVGEIESVDAATGQKAPKRVGRKRKRSEVDGEIPERGEERMNVEEKDPKRKVSHKYIKTSYNPGYLGTSLPPPPAATTN
jgi:hypothetical protein